MLAQQAAETLDPVLDAGEAQAVPEVRLVAEYHGLGDCGFDCVDDRQHPERTATEKERVGVRRVDRTRPDKA